MDAKALANKMHEALYCHLDCEGYDKADVDKILIAGLTEAEREAIINVHEKCASERCRACEIRGWNAAREKARDIALGDFLEKGDDNCARCKINTFAALDKLADRIAKMEPEK